VNKQAANTASKPAKKGAKVKKRVNRNVPSGVAHVLASFNNTVVTITDPAGNVVSWSSAGKANFKGSRKSSAYAATVAAQEAGRAAMSMGMKEVEVNLKGPGAGRESAVRGLQSAGLFVTTIRDRTPVAHNGCRPRKRRRV
jgi:small subunit ribosomal protein S11